MDEWLAAWRAWFAGNPAGDMTLLGATVTGWNRAGMVMEFIAAWIILAEIIGPDRIRKYGASIRTQVSRPDPREVVRETIEWAKAWAAFIFSRPGSTKEQENLDKTGGYVADNVNFVVAFVLTLAVIAFGPVPINVGALDADMLVAAGQIAGFALGVFFAYAVILVGAAPFATVIVFAVMAAITLAISRPILAVAAILDHPNNTRALKIASFLLLSFGFQFDLLAA